MAASPDSALLGALDDMADIKPDVVNMSLGRTAGMDSAADTLFAGVYEKLQEKGITLDVAGGNEFQAGYGNKSGKNLPYASDPDSSHPSVSQRPHSSVGLCRLGR